MDPPRKISRRWWVWVLVPLAALAGAMSAFPDPAVRTVEYKYGAMSTYGLDVRVWGVRLQKERVTGTPATLRAQALVREQQWRWRLATGSALVSGRAAAVVAAALFRRIEKPASIG